MSTASPEGALSNAGYEPTFLNARREAIIITIIWVVAFLWTILYCAFTGYQENVDPENLDLVMGIPSWIFWGVGAPWLVADLFTLWFALIYMKDDDLGEDPGHEATETSADQGGEA